MARNTRLTRRGPRCSRRWRSAAAACWDDWFGTKKTPLPGKREPILGGRRTLTVDEGVPKVVLPPEVRNAAWPQAGGNPAHFMGHLAAGERLAEAWSANIGAGGGYRRKILAQPVAADGIVYVMDSDAVVSAFDIAGGGRVWRFDTKQDEDDSTNVGGGLALDQGTLYAVNGLAELVALDAAKGTVRWRSKFGAPDPFRAHRGGGPAVPHHDRGPAAGAGHR